MKRQLATLCAVACALTIGGITMAQSIPANWEREFPLADFTTSSVDFNSIQSGGPGRDGIPAINDPTMIPINDDQQIQDIEPVMAIEIDGHARAYPLRYLIWHEIVNDQLAGVPIAVTFCPLCNSGLVFDRRHDGQVLSFGVSGKLRASDMVMYDHQTESFWQQALGEGIVGKYTGDQLVQLPAAQLPWSLFKSRHPDGLVMARPDYPRDYGQNPYVGYDGQVQPMLYRGDPPPHGVPALARVVRVGTTAYLLVDLAEAGVVKHGDITLTWGEGLASALDTGKIADGRDVGFVEVTDATGKPLAHDVMFAFAFDAFYPDGKWVIKGDIR